MGLEVGEELAVWVETFLFARPLSGEAVGDPEAAFERCTDFDDDFFLLSRGDLRHMHTWAYIKTTRYTSVASRRNDTCNKFYKSQNTLEFVHLSSVTTLSWLDNLGTLVCEEGIYPGWGLRQISVENLVETHGDMGKNMQKSTQTVNQRLKLGILEL